MAYKSRYTGIEIDSLLSKVGPNEKEIANIKDQIENGLPGGEGNNYVTAYGAKGDGVADDTTAFQTALAESRTVFVPGGTYKLSSGIVIGDNSMLELSQDTVLNFTNTDGNCITLGMLSNLKGNHATINVPYEFTGNVLYAYSNEHLEQEINAVPPWTKWDPMWKSGRYVTDINICKADSRGFHYSVNGECNGTAVYLSADNTVGMSTFMWGIHFSGLRIAGAFSYGIRAVNFDEGWMHEMRVDAFIDACEIGVSLEDCNNAYVSAIIQPRPAYTMNNVYVPYAKHGIQMIRSKNVDLSGSRVWDWNDTNTLWTDGGEYQHISMIGECRGCILNDFFYYETNIDIREQIYTDRATNLEQMTILQEPITRWFKPIDGAPYFGEVGSEHRLITQEDLAMHFDTDFIKDFTDVLPTAIDTDGSIFSDKGYVKSGYRIVGSTGALAEDAYYGCTGFIPIKSGDTLNVQDIKIGTGDGWAPVVIYNSKFERLIHVNTNNSSFQNGDSYYVHYTPTLNGFKLVVAPNNDPKETAYIRLCFLRSWVGESPMIAINEKIGYTIESFLSDKVKVKGENVIGEVGVVQPDWVATKEAVSGGADVLAETSISFASATFLLAPVQKGFKANVGVKYDVYWNGEYYRCVAFEHSGELFLGNADLNTVVTSPYSNPSAPFLFSGYGDTINMVTKSTSTAEKVTLSVLTGVEYEYNKMPEEYLPDGVVKSVNGKTPDETGNVSVETGGGSGIDVTASIGQTIIVKEVDANGKPTAWESADYPVGAKIYTLSELQLMTYDELAAEYEEHPIIYRHLGGTSTDEYADIILGRSTTDSFYGIGYRRNSYGVYTALFQKNYVTEKLVGDIRDSWIPYSTETLREGYLFYSYGGWRTKDIDLTGSILQIDPTQLTDGAMINVPYESYVKALSKTQTTYNLSIGTTDAGGNIILLPALYVSVGPDQYPTTVKCFNPAGSDIITVTLIPVLS